MKTHKTVKITREFLVTHIKPCSGGLAAIESLLPAVISTDPEQNLDLAVELASSPRAEHDDIDYFLFCVAWFVERQRATLKYQQGISVEVPKVHAMDNPHSRSGEDAFVIAQQLAWAADELLDLEGK